MCPEMLEKGGRRDKPDECGEVRGRDSAANATFGGGEVRGGADRATFTHWTQKDG